MLSYGTSKLRLHRLVFLLVLGLILVPQITTAQYEDGSYGSCSYGQECTSTSSSPSSTTTSQESTTPTPGAGIFLNDYSEYATPTGKQLTLEAGQTVYYEISEAGVKTKYTLSVESVSDGYVVIVMPNGSKQKITVGESIQFDSDGDAKNDIIISLKSINGKTAVLGFSSVMPQAIQTIAQTKKANSSKSSIVLYALITALGVTMFMLLLAKRRKRRAEENSS